MSTLDIPLLLKAAARTPVDRTPVWFMRQAGRCLPEYREIRKKYSLLDICANPDLATEVTLQPVRRFGVDAAILFADILLPLPHMGLQLSFAAGEGPVIGNPVRTIGDVQSLRTVNVYEELGTTVETVKMLRAALPASVALIGFVGCPFTVATYVIEGGRSDTHALTKQMMYEAPDVWHALMSRLTTVLGDFLVAQVEAGAQAVQLFDSWAGTLTNYEYQTFALPYSKALSDRVKGMVPRIHFGTGASHLLSDMRSAGAEVVGIDWRIGIDDGWSKVGYDCAVQGNLDPAALFLQKNDLERAVNDVLIRAAGRVGHVFNLGHGVRPDTPVDSICRVVEQVREITSK